MYGNVPVKSMNVHSYEMDTNDATLRASDMQAGVTAYAKGKKIVGTGKAFSFAMYGKWNTNLPIDVPETINTVQIGSLDYSVRMVVGMNSMSALDFSTEINVAEVTIDNVVYPITVSVQNGMLTFACDKTINIQIFYGRDEYA